MNLTINLDPVPLRLDASGTVRIGLTRVTLDSVVTTDESGSTPEEIGEQFPSLALADIYSVVGYYLNNRKEIDAYLTQRRTEADEIRRQHEMRDDPTGLRERLLARQAAL